MQQINYQELLKDQAVFIFMPIILLALLIGGCGYIGQKAYNHAQTFETKTKELETLSSQKEGLENQIKELSTEEASPETKKIYELAGMQFGMDASFAPQFDNMINIAKESGIRIRSVEYNYSPEEDPIFKAKIPNHNVCELDTTVVGNYSEIQRFLKTLVAQDYLVNLAQLEIVSWQRDKSILIANMKLRFYTKTN